MSTSRPLFPTTAGRLAVSVAAVCLAVTPFTAFGQGKKKNPASKVYISDVSGDAQIDTGDTIQDLSKRSVYTAQGTVIETKAADSGESRSRSYSTMVYSNGTGAFFDADTRVEVQKFSQEPFTPNRTDVDMEPSISQTQAFVARGAVGLCASKLVAGSNMTYRTAHGSVNVQGRKLVIEAGKDVTKISVLEGQSTVRAGAMDMGGHTVQAGEQAVIRSGGVGQPNIIEIQKIPPQDAPALDNRVTMACNAKKTVYFEVVERPESNETLAAGADTPNEAAGAENPPAGGDEASGAVTAFDGNSAPRGNVPTREIVAVPVMPVQLPMEHTLSAATIPAPTG